MIEKVGGNREVTVSLFRHLRFGEVKEMSFSKRKKKKKKGTN